MPSFDAYAGAALTPGGAFQGVSDLVDAIISGQNEKQKLLNQRAQQDTTNSLAERSFGQQMSNQLADNTRQDNTLTETVRHNKASEGIATTKANAGKPMTFAQIMDAATKHADRDLGIDGGKYTTTDETIDPIFHVKTVKVNTHQLNENKPLLAQRSALIEKYAGELHDNGGSAADIVQGLAPAQAPGQKPKQAPQNDNVMSRSEFNKLSPEYQQQFMADGGVVQ